MSSSCLASSSASLATLKLRCSASTVFLRVSLRGTGLGEGAGDTGVAILSGDLSSSLCLQTSWLFGGPDCAEIQVIWLGAGLRVYYWGHSACRHSVTVVDGPCEARTPARQQAPQTLDREPSRPDARTCVIL